MIIQISKKSVTVADTDCGYYKQHVTVSRELWDKLEVERLASASLLKQWQVSRDARVRQNKGRVKGAGIPRQPAKLKFKGGDNEVDRLIGKEIVCYLWMAEDLQPDNAQDIYTCQAMCWNLEPEMRWWFYTMTNADSGWQKDHDRGWRKALRAIGGD